VEPRGVETGTPAGWDDDPTHAEAAAGINLRSATPEELLEIANSGDPVLVKAARDEINQRGDREHERQMWAMRRHVRNHDVAVAAARRQANRPTLPRPRGRQTSHARPSVRRPVRQRARSPGRLSGDDDPSPPDLVRLAAASVRLWAHVQRREARRRLAA
jgi:hypothetical protein